MKSIWLNSCLLLAIVAAAILHSVKINKEESDIARLETALRGIEKVIPRHTNVSCRLINTDPDVFFWTRYLLAPRSLVDNGILRDTVLTICRPGVPDSTILRITNGRKLIWSNGNTFYQCYLTAKSRF